jgi:hypothetical protein
MEFNSNLFHWLVLGPFLLFLGYYKGDVHPAFYTVSFTAGLMTTVYYFYKWVYEKLYRIKNIY